MTEEGDSSTTQQALIGDTEEAAKKQPKNRVSLRTWLKQQKEDSKDDVASSIIKYTQKLFKTIRERLPDYQIYGIELCVSGIQLLLCELETLCTLKQTAPPYPWSQAIKAGHTAGSKVNYQVDAALSQDVWHSAFSDDNRQSKEIEAIIELAVVSARPSRRYNRAQGAVYRDFAREYKDLGAINDLQRTLHGYNTEMNGEELYAPVLVVLQSSGTGKTRTVLQLCTRELGLYTCLRPSDDPRVVSAPPADRAVTTFLSRKEPSILEPDESIEAATRTMAAWLSAFFEKFADYCEGVVKNSKLNIGSQADWSRFPAIIAEELYDGITPGFHVIRTPTPSRTSNVSNSSDRGEVSDYLRRPETPTVRECLLSEILTRATELKASKAFPTKNTDSAGHFDPSAEKYASYMVPALKRLKELRKGMRGLTFVAFDEALSLGQLRLEALRRLASHLRKLDFWVLLLDTNNQVSELTGEVARLASTRLDTSNKRYRRPVPPFVILRTDIFLHSEPTRSQYLQAATGNRQVTHLDCLRFIPQMGRPLWNDSSWEGFQDEKGSRLFRIPLQAILEKLLSEHNMVSLTKRTSSTAAAQLIALTNQRLPLNIVGIQGLHSEPSFVETQIAHHLRVVVAVEVDGTGIRSWIPSEPLLSMAAADLFRRDPQRMWGAAVETIARLAKSHALNLGESGEEHVRTAVSAAVDFAFHKCYGSRIPGIEDLDPRQENRIDLPDHLFVVSVRDWLIELLGPEPFAEDPDLARWSSRRWLNFTHFGVLGQAFKEEMPLPRTHLAEAWVRQIAFTSNITQPKWDLLIVCLESENRPKLEDLLDIRKLCPIFIKVKNRDEHHPSPLSRLEDLGASAFDSEECPTGVLSIYISLAAASPKIECATRTLKGNAKSLSIYVGCNEHHPLEIFKQPSEARSGGFSSHKAAQSLLGRWTGLFNSKIDIDDHVDHFLRTRFFFHANNPEHITQVVNDDISATDDTIQAASKHSTQDATGSKGNLTQAKRNAGNVAKKSLKRKTLESENAGPREAKKQKTGQAEPDKKSKKKKAGMAVKQDGSDKKAKPKQPNQQKRKLTRRKRSNRTAHETRQKGLGTSD